MAIYDVTDPTGPVLLGFATKDKDQDRFKHAGAHNGYVVCTVRLNPSYEAHFSMTPDHAREIAVKLIDAAEQAEFQAESEAERIARQRVELVNRGKRKTPGGKAE